MKLINLSMANENRLNPYLNQLNHIAEERFIVDS